MTGSSASEKLAKMPKPGTVREKLYYLKLSLFHPFEGFYDIRFRGKGSLVLAFIIIAVYGAVECAAYQYTGFIFNLNDIHEMNSISIFLSSTLIIGLFCLSNWTVTTLFNGKGNMRSIFTVTAYSMVPYVISRIVYVFLSNYVIEDEAMIVNMIVGVGVVWFVFLLVAGLCVAHEYGLFKNLAALVVTAIAAFIIIFVFVLFLTLEEKMFSFIVDVVKEFIRRQTL
ncbi:MAG: YIP1 family protein [Lachnospiraceae bacterium]|nr:YIP1 family protein [Lachnospiraceae bacterium]MBP5185182.1 YIP1 family protein [Lachnospiraceae bacterium]